MEVDVLSLRFIGFNCVSVAMHAAVIQFTYIEDISALAIYLSTLKH